MKQALKKPGYSMTRAGFIWSFVLSWLTTLALVAGALTGREHAVEMANITVPSMVALIVAVLGIHRAFGSVDMRTIARASETEADESENKQ